MESLKYMDEDTVVKKGIEALIKELDHPDTVRFINLPDPPFSKSGINSGLRITSGVTGRAAEFPIKLVMVIERELKKKSP